MNTRRIICSIYIFFFFVHLVYITINLFPMFLYIVLNIIYICVCAIFVDIIICVLFVGRGQSISCDNFLSNPTCMYSHSSETTTKVHVMLNNCQINLIIPPLHWKGGILVYLCPSFRLSVLPSVPKYFSSHFPQQLLMAEI